jgi:hypothetical protein
MRGLQAATACVMLRWTCRLRDVLQRGGYQADTGAPRLTCLREAEFVRNVETNGFPSKFDWYTLNDWFTDRAYFVNLYGETVNGGIDCRCPFGVDAYYEDPIRALEGQPVADGHGPKIDILWLSPAVFLSPYIFKLAGSLLAEYCVTVTQRGGSEKSYNVYSLCDFGDENHSANRLSPLPLKMLTYMAAQYRSENPDDPIPVGLKTVSLSVYNCTRHFPRLFLKKFLSIIPHHDPMLQQEKKSAWTVFRIEMERKITADDLRAVFSHRFHPNVKVSFDLDEDRDDQSKDNPFDESVTMDVFNALLGESTHPFALQLPPTFSQTEWTGPSRTILKSPKLTTFCDGVPSCAPLESFSKMQRVNDIEIFLPSGFFSGQSRQQLLRSWINVIFAVPSIQQVQIHFEYEVPSDYVECDVEHVVEHIVKDLAQKHRQVRRWIKGAIPACTSKSLISFNVKCHEQNLDYMREWDRDLFPSLVLNRGRTLLFDSTKKGMIPLIVKAVNEQKAYRQVTELIPCSTTIANAGMIFWLLKHGLKQR